MSAPTQVHPEPATTLRHDAGHHPGSREAPDDDLQPYQEPETPVVLPAEEEQLLALGNRLLMVLADLQGERAANAAAEKIQVEFLRARYRRIDEPLARRLAGIERSLEAIHLQLPLRGKAKSHKLAFGVIGTRTKAQRVEVTDAEAVILAVKENAEPDVAALIVRAISTEKVDHRALTSFMAGNGWAELPGTVVHPATETFYAEPDSSEAIP